jgi:hypothetical protein
LLVLEKKEEIFSKKKKKVQKVQEIEIRSVFEFF